MAGAIKMRVKVEGVRQLMRKLKADDTLAGPWQHAMKKIGDAGLAAGRGAAPSGPSGQTKALLVSKMQARPVPKWVSVRTTAKRSSRKYRNYRYPRRLEYDPKSRHKGWLTNAIKRIGGQIQGALSGAAREIEGRWRT